MRPGRANVTGLRQLLAAVVLGGIGIFACGPALGGPPFVTDDPEPVDLGHWEIYGFTAGMHVRGDTSGVLAAWK